jgi:thiamine-monophosphate kinase
MDDAAVLDVGGKTLVLTHDMIAEGVHFLPSDPPGDVAWKLIAVNLSDLAAKGARPIGLLLGYSLGEEAWNRAFVEGLRQASAHFSAPLLGGDTISMPPGATRAFGLTAIGEAGARVPSRADAVAGDTLWVTGTIGDSLAGLRIAAGEVEGPASLLARYRRPEPRLQAGRALAPLVHAMMDVSDGLLIDAGRMAAASGLALEIDLARVPISRGYADLFGEDLRARSDASIAGDDYELLFSAPASEAGRLSALSQELRLAFAAIGTASAGSGLRMTIGGEPVPLPRSLGYEHGIS